MATSSIVCRTVNWLLRTSRMFSRSALYPSLLPFEGLPDHAATGLGRERHIDPDFAGLRLPMAGLELDVADDAVAVEHDIIASVVGI